MSDRGDPTTSGAAAPRGWLSIFGPAIIVASVVLGPGSILTASKVGAQYGYAMVWVLVAASAMMMGMVALAARLGVTMRGTMCDELAARFGRPVAVFVGLTMFLIIASFQASNNIAVVAAIEPLLGEAPSPRVGAAVLVSLNIAIVAAIYGLRRLYKPIERLMMLLVAMMIVGFAANLAFARPSPIAFLVGLVPSLPADARGGVIPHVKDGAIVDPLWAVTGLIATTFSIAGAFYQSYLVREKGWGVGDVRRGLIDSMAGIAVLGGVSLVIMATSAAVFAGRIDAASLNTVGDVATQLEPAFGRSAMWLFAMGIFAGAFSSFLVNAMIGGVVLADSLGLGGRMDQRGPRAMTVAALAIGGAVGVALHLAQKKPSDVSAIVYAQALTVLGGPALALTLAYFAMRPAPAGAPRVPAWLRAVAVVGVVLSAMLAARTGWRLYLQMTLTSG